MLFLFGFIPFVRFALRTLNRLLIRFLKPFMLTRWSFAFAFFHSFTSLSILANILPSFSMFSVFMVSAIAFLAAMPHSLFTSMDWHPQPFKFSENIHYSSNTTNFECSLFLKIVTSLMPGSSEITISRPSNFPLCPM